MKKWAISYFKPCMIFLKTRRDHSTRDLYSMSKKKEDHSTCRHYGYYCQRYALCLGNRPHTAHITNHFTLDNVYCNVAPQRPEFEPTPAHLHVLTSTPGLRQTKLDREPQIVVERIRTLSSRLCPTDIHTVKHTGKPVSTSRVHTNRGRRRCRGDRVS